jgi:hypothetical protein
VTIFSWTSSFFFVDSAWIVSASGGSSGPPAGSSMPRERRNASVPACRGLPST